MAQQVPGDRGFWSSVGSVLLGTAAAQAVPVVASLAIARLFSPDAFGSYASWLGLVLLLAVVVTGRFEQSIAIVEPGAPRRAAVRATLATAVLATSILALLTALIVWVVPADRVGMSRPLLLLVLPAGLAVAVGQVWQSWAAADGAYRELTWLRLLPAVLVAAAQIGVGALLPSAIGLAVAHVGGLLTAVAIGTRMRPLGPRAASEASVRGFWREHRAFPLYSLPADSINTASVQLPVLLVASRFGTEIAGQLALTIRVLGAPIGLLGRAVLDVFKRHAADAYRQRGECRREFVRTLVVLGGASAVSTAAFALVVERLFPFAFGPDWAHAGTIALWLLPLFAFRFIASPLSYMMYIAGKQHVDLVWQLALLGATVLTLRVLDPSDVAIKGYAAAYCALYAISLGMSYHYSSGRTA